MGRFMNLRIFKTFLFSVFILVMVLLSALYAAQEGPEIIPPTKKKTYANPCNPCGPANPCNPCARLTGNIETGKKLFFDRGKTACSVCHKINTDKKKAPVGPGLKGVTKRHSIEWLAKWLKNPKEVWASNDPETLEMKKWLGLEKRKKTKMAVKKPLTSQEIQDICSFLETL